MGFFYFCVWQCLATDGSGKWTDPRSVPEGGQAAMQRAYNLGWMTHMSKRTSIYALAGYAEKVGFYNDMKASFYTVGLAHKF